MAGASSCLSAATLHAACPLTAHPLALCSHFAAVDNHEAYIKDVRDMMANNFPRA